MLVNNSHNDPKVTKIIDDAVGKPFSLMERLKMKGVGSPKMRITEASVHIYNFLILDNNTNTCNIELRPNGILIGFQKRLETYLLVIPYYKLIIYKGKSEEYSFYKDTYFIKVLAKTTDLKTHQFVKRILDAKEKLKPTNLEDL